MADGSRIEKSNILINAIGEIDELNSWVGLLSSLPELGNQVDVLKKIQNCLFDIGGSLTMRSANSFDSSHILLLDQNINAINNELPHLDNFILPGGHASSAWIHIARTTCRRAERTIVEAKKSELLDMNILVYINRLSDFFFVLARKINIDLGIEEVNWSQE